MVQWLIMGSAMGSLGVGGILCGPTVAFIEGTYFIQGWRVLKYKHIWVYKSGIFEQSGTFPYCGFFYGRALCWSEAEYYTSYCEGGKMVHFRNHTMQAIEVHFRKYTLVDRVPRVGQEVLQAIVILADSAFQFTGFMRFKPIKIFPPPTLWNASAFIRTEFPPIQA